MLHVTYDFCRNSLKLCLIYNRGNRSPELQWRSMEQRDVPLPDLCTSSFHATEEVLLLQTTYSHVFILGHIPVFSGLQLGELKAPCFQGTGKRQSPHCAGCRGFSSSVTPTALSESWKISCLANNQSKEKKDDVNLKADNEIRSKGKQ